MPGGREGDNGAMDRIVLEGMVFSGHHGVRPAEREQAQDFKVDVEIDADAVEASTPVWAVFGDLMGAVDSIRLPASDEPSARIAQGELYRLLDAIRKQESTYKSAGSVHGCALFRQGELLTFVEDVGRHNAIDTIAGWMWLNDIAGGDKIFYTTGRLTSEMVMKSAQMGVPIIVSRSGITQMGYELAMRLGLALFGRATNRHFICYSGFDRFDAEPEPPRA